MLQRRLLQITVGLAVLVPITAGLCGMLRGVDAFMETPATLAADSHIRYLSGLLFGIGLGFASCIPHIEKNIARFQLLTVIVFIGGLARACGIIMNGNPGTAMWLGLGMEVLVTPLLAFWQYRVSQRLA